MEQPRNQSNELLDFDIKPADPPAGLFLRIIERIATEKRIKAAKKAFVYFSVSLALFLASLSGVIFILTSWILGSEFVKILSLIFSDAGAVILNWKDFGFFVLESAPLEYLAFFFLACFILLLSLRYIAKYSSGAFNFFLLANSK